MKRIKVHRIPKFKKKILVVLIILLCLPISFTLGRFVYNKVLDLYFTSKNFFFESDKLTVDGAVYSLDYWNGVDPYNVVINLNSFKNNELKSTSDVTYEINYTCSSEIICNTLEIKKIYDDEIAYLAMHIERFRVSLEK